MAVRPTMAGFSVGQRAFCLEYLRNGFKAGPAYLKAHPHVTRESSYEEGSRLLRHPKVGAYLKAKTDEHWKALQIDGDQALARVALDATADMSTMYDADGGLLPPHEWPPALWNSIESFEKSGEFGQHIKVKLVSKGQARRTILEVTGKLRGMSDSFDALAEAIRGDQKKHGKAQGK